MAVLLRGTSAAATTVGPSSALVATTFRRSRGRLLHRAAPQRRLYVARASAQPLEVCAKESITVPGRLGDCPFTQRVLLTIEEKHLPYELKLVDLANKPDWYLSSRQVSCGAAPMQGNGAPETYAAPSSTLLGPRRGPLGMQSRLFEINPEGKVPIVKLEEKWIGDSDVITQTLEEKYPEPPLTTPPEKASVGSKIFSTFIGFLKSKDPSDETEEALLNELTSFDSYLKDNGPFINGGTISAADLSLGPKLYHMEIALGHYKNWSVPDSLSHVKTYMKSIFSTDSFVKTQALPEDVIAGWRPKVMG